MEIGPILSAVDYYPSSSSTNWFCFL